MTHSYFEITWSIINHRYDSLLYFNQSGPSSQIGNIAQMGNTFPN